MTCPLSTGTSSWVERLWAFCRISAPQGSHPVWFLAWKHMTCSSTFPASFALHYAGYYSLPTWLAWGRPRRWWRGSEWGGRWRVRGCHDGSVNATKLSQKHQHCKLTPLISVLYMREVDIDNRSLQLCYFIWPINLTVLLFLDRKEIERLGFLITEQP